jgi:hypothetical protein
MFVCANPACKRIPELHQIPLIIDGKEWTVPIYICHNEVCLIKAGAERND